MVHHKEAFSHFSDEREEALGMRLGWFKHQIMRCIYVVVDKFLGDILAVMVLPNTFSVNLEWQICLHTHIGKTTFMLPLGIDYFRIFAIVFAFILELRD